MVSKSSILIALTATLLSSGAYASDIYGKGSTKDGEAATSSGIVNWTGFYIGGSLGYGHANHNLTVEQYNGSYCYDEPVQPFSSYDEATTLGDHYAIPAGGACLGSGTDGIDSSNADVTVPASVERLGGIDGLDSSGLVGDGRIGFDFARGRFLFGVFGSYGFSDMEAKGDIGTLGSLAYDTIEKKDEWSLGARAGLIVAPRTLAYILAAYTEADYGFGGTDLSTPSNTRFNHDVTFSGVTVGGGVEFALTQNVFLGIEGSHTFYGKETVADFKTGVDGADAGQRVNDDIDETKVMGTLKIKLNGGSTGLGF